VNNIGKSTNIFSDMIVFLCRMYPGPWQVLRKVKDNKYELLHEQGNMPSLKEVALNILPSAWGFTMYYDFQWLWIDGDETLHCQKLHLKVLVVTYLKSKPLLWGQSPHSVIACSYNCSSLHIHALVDLWTIWSGLELLLKTLHPISSCMFTW